MQIGIDELSFFPYAKAGAVFKQSEPTSVYFERRLIELS